MAKILIIDDSPALIAKVRETLESEKFEVDELSSFLDLPDKVRASPPDLILLDIQMPMMPGKMAAEYIRKYEEKPIPVLIHSSQPVEELEHMVKTTQATGYIRKDDPQGKLVLKIREVLGA